jgi:SanA protein
VAFVIKIDDTPMRFRRTIHFSPRQRRKRLILGSLLFVAAVSGLLIYVDVHGYGRLICPSAAVAPVRPVAIVFGAASIILTDRVATGAALYKAGKVRKLLLTGDNSRNGYNEPEAMREQALQMGVPARDIVCDYAGFRTYDSLYRARDIFGVHSAILVTQRYHLPRALFIGSQLGMDVVGVDAAKRVYGGQLGFDLREIGAVEVAWFQSVIFHPRPKYLGRREPLFTDTANTAVPASKNP